MRLMAALQGQAVIFKSVAIVVQIGMKCISNATLTQKASQATEGARRSHIALQEYLKEFFRCAGAEVRQHSAAHVPVQQRSIRLIHVG